MASKAFEKKFAAERAKGSKKFSFGGKDYNTKLAKAPTAKKKSSAKKVDLPKSFTPGPSRADAVKSMGKGPSTSVLSDVAKQKPFKGGMAMEKTYTKGPQTRPNLTERMNPNQKNNVDIGKKKAGTVYGTGSVVSGMGGASGTGKGASGTGKPVTTMAKVGSAAKKAVNSVMKKQYKF